MRLLTLIAALALTILGTLAHGRLTYRWTRGEALPSAGKTLTELPGDFGEWRLDQKFELDEKTQGILQAAGYISRKYIHTETRQAVQVAIIVGPPGPTSVHIPEICYSSKAYEIEGESRKFSFPDANGTEQELWGMTLRSLNPTAGILRVAYGWSAGDRWIAPDNPRISMRMHSVLYKIQLATKLPRGANPQDSDPLKDFLVDFLPFAQQSIVEPAEPSSE